ncbi:calcium-binding protein [Algirhabdus cladophorae]|uniref:calcium-binding protein n=1 Tax=Algirhabdus cladophorae TaxID=3377108 RepID=UPI003B84B19D
MTLLNIFGDVTNIIEQAFANLPQSGHNELSFTSTELVIQHPVTGIIIRIIGTNLAPAPEGLSGTVTAVQFVDGISVLAAFTQLDVDAGDFSNAVGAINDGDFTLFDAIIFDDLEIDATSSPVGNEFDLAEGPEGVRLDGSSFADIVTATESKDTINGRNGDDTINANGGSDTIRGGNGNDFVDAGNGNDKVYGGLGDDFLFGGNGNDLLDVGGGDDTEIVVASKGDDTIVYSDATVAFQGLHYFFVNRAINVTIDGDANTGTVAKGTWGTDTIVDVRTTLLAGDSTGGLGLVGSYEDDVFNIDGGANTWASIRGGLGADAYNLEMSGTIRLDFSHSLAQFEDADGTEQGMRINVSTGNINNDGWGNQETLTLTGGSARLEIRGTAFDDAMTGSSGRESFITSLGNDTVDGKGGADRIRFDRSEVDSVEVDLSQGTATLQSSQGSFTQSLANIEDVRGSRDGDDGIIGSDAVNVIQGRGGDDDILGLKGADFLYGEDGEDGINGGRGADYIDGGDGKDFLRGGNGDDTIIGGQGIDKMEGNAGADTFVFSADGGTGNDRIRDFEDGVDTLRFEGFGTKVDGFGDVTVSSSGGDTTIDWNGGSVVLLDFSGTIDANDFDFFIP